MSSTLEPRNPPRSRWYEVAWRFNNSFSHILETLPEMKKTAARRRLWTTGSAESATAQCDQRRRHRVMHAHGRIRIVQASGG
ncbi:hypothetical protein DPMN_104655 [Dreissena polymorpha]|uniref:Uncharacterized protein n=1 Tax=Dreissena polymorpha TaxID=45954 RepID=A0A9D4HCE6_DREPO|nr:hypothetical protein DPMN_104655 [Dreissena polymorpha]